MTEIEIRKCIEVMESLVADGSSLADLEQSLRVALMSAAGKLSRPTKFALRVRNREIEKSRRQKLVLKDKSLRQQTGIREARRQAVYVAPSQISGAAEAPTLENTRHCYVCKAEFNKLHFFYDCMCPGCADFNYKKRFQTAPLHGQVALITGARLKIGYQAALLMLRAGAKVAVTTRFPVDAARRFAREDDFAVWGERLEVHGLDLRHTPSVELFTRFFEERHERLDILINNAAQTVRRPPGFYTHLMEEEKKSLSELGAFEQKILNAHFDFKRRLAGPSEGNLPVSWQAVRTGAGIVHSAELSQIPYAFDNALVHKEVFPDGRLDADLQQVDLRRTNSWRQSLSEVNTPEMLEVQLVNSVAPFVLCSRLAPLMRKNPTGQKHIVNVTAMEGKFSRYTKTDKHPHTNMAKAALNMLTHTSAKDLVKDGIYMNAVDTGWVTDEDPMELSLRKQEAHDFQPPLDIVDGAARVCDPFFDGILTGKHRCGQFLKDYLPTDW